MHVLMLYVYIIMCVWPYDGCKVVYVCICETMPCVDAVFMYSMLVVAGDSWWSLPLNVCVLCGHTHFRFSFKLMPFLDLKWKHLSSRIFFKLKISQRVGCFT